MNSSSIWGFVGVSIADSGEFTAKATEMGLFLERKVLGFRLFVLPAVNSDSRSEMEAKLRAAIVALP